MDININRNSVTPIYTQIKNSIENMIDLEELPKGYKLPSERQLAAELGVHRNTVVKAYSELVSEGMVVTSRYSPRGYFVKETTSSQTFGNRFFPLEKMMLYDINDKEKMFLDIFTDSFTREYISFGGIAIDEDISSVEEMKNILQNMFKTENSREMANSQFKETERTKINILKMLAEENIYASPKNIQIVSETNQALNYLMTLYLKKGDVVIVEEPIVPDNACVFRNKELEIITVAMENDGMDLNQLETLIIKYNPKFIYTMPNYHNPTGTLMSLSKREKLLEICNRYGVPIIEEDSQRDFRYQGNKIPSLYALDKSKSVVYIDSFTLTFPYGIKTGYILGPYDLVDMLGRLIVVDETFVSNMGQYILNEYISGNHFAKHKIKLRNHYKKKLDLLCKELDKIVKKGITYEKPKGGLLLWCTLSEEINEKLLFEKSQEMGLIIMPGFLFYPFGYQGNGHIRLSFSNVSDEEIIKGVKILGKAIDKCRRKKKISK